MNGASLQKRPIHADGTGLWEAPELVWLHGAAGFANAGNLTAQICRLQGPGALAAQSCRFLSRAWAATKTALPLQDLGHSLKRASEVILVGSVFRSFEIQIFRVPHQIGEERAVL